MLHFAADICEVILRVRCVTASAAEIVFFPPRYALGERLTRITFAGAVGLRRCDDAPPVLRASLSAFLSRSQTNRSLAPLRLNPQFQNHLPPIGSVALQLFHSDRFWRHACAFAFLCNRTVVQDITSFTETKRYERPRYRNDTLDAALNGCRHKNVPELVQHDPSVGAKMLLADPAVRAASAFRSVLTRIKILTTTNSCGSIE